MCQIFLGLILNKYVIIANIIGHLNITDRMLKWNDRPFYGIFIYISVINDSEMVELMIDD